MFDYLSTATAAHITTNLPNDVLQVPDALLFSLAVLNLLLDVTNLLPILFLTAQWLVFLSFLLFLSHLFPCLPNLALLLLSLLEVLLSSALPSLLLLVFRSLGLGRIGKGIKLLRLGRLLGLSQTSLHQRLQRNLISQSKQLGSQ